MLTCTNSQGKAYHTCQRLHQYRYEEGYRPIEDAAALVTGTGFHKGMEAWWNSAKYGDDAAARLMAAVCAIQALNLDPYNQALLEALLIGYTARWGDEPYEVVEVEAEFTAPIINPATGAASRTWQLGGKMDVLVRSKGRGMIMEHKTTSEDIGPGSFYWRRLSIDSQISTYYEGAETILGDVWGCVYDVIRKPALKPYKATPEESRKYKANGELYANQRDHDEMPDEYRARLLAAIEEEPGKYFQRAELVRLEKEIEDYRFDLWQTTQSIRESQLAKRWPRNPDACARYGRICDFFPVCTGETSLDDPNLYRKVETVHEELTAVQRPKEEGSHNAASNSQNQ